MSGIHIMAIQNREKIAESLQTITFTTEPTMDNVICVTVQLKRGTKFIEIPMEHWHEFMHHCNKLFVL